MSSTAVVVTPDAPSASPRRRRTRRQVLGRRLSPLLWVGPAIVLIAFAVIWPVVTMVQSAFLRISSYGVVGGSAGWANFQNLFNEPDITAILWRTVVWVLAVVAFTVAISLGL